MLKKSVNIVLILIGILICLFPFAKSCIGDKSQKTDLTSYDTELENGQTMEYAEQWTAAKEYNRTLARRAPQDAFSAESFIEDEAYEALLNVGGNGMMGYVEIPSIDVTLPIYHGTTKESLEKGVGHLLGSSLPVGGKGTHSVLAGHTGLASATMFNDLDQVKIGELFYIHIMGETLCYKVTQIDVVKPEETDILAIDDDQDYVTLLTCTPYGINSHRLLVRGTRVPYSGATYAEVIENVKTPVHWGRIALGVLFVVLGAVIGIGTGTFLKKRGKSHVNKKKHKKVQ